MAFGDVYQLRLTGEYLGQVVQAVFNYKHVVGESVATALTWNDTFKSDVLPSIVAVASENLEYTQIETINWRDPSDFYIDSINFQGDIPVEDNDSLAAWLTLYFRFNRNFPGQHHGSKRFAGGVESMFTDGAPAALWATEMTALANALAGGLTASLDRTARYYVVDRTGNPELGANPPGYVSSSVTYRGLGTQKSRKV